VVRGVGKQVALKKKITKEKVKVSSRCHCIGLFLFCLRASASKRMKLQKQTTTNSAHSGRAERELAFSYQRKKVVLSGPTSSHHSPKRYWWDDAAPRTRRRLTIHPSAPHRKEESIRSDQAASHTQGERKKLKQIILHSLTRK